MYIFIITPAPVPIPGRRGSNPNPNPHPPFQAAEAQIAAIEDRVRRNDEGFFGQLVKDIVFILSRGVTEATGRTLPELEKALKGWEGVIEQKIKK